MREFEVSIVCRVMAEDPLEAILKVRSVFPGADPYHFLNRISEGSKSKISSKPVGGPENELR